MSKVGKNPISIPEGVEVKLSEGLVEVKGPKGNLSMEYDNNISVEMKENEITLDKKRNDKKTAALWGLTRALIANMIGGVKDGYQKQLELEGVGFRMSVKGKQLDMALGFSHPVLVDIPEGLEVTIDKNILTVSGINKQAVGQFAAEIRALKKVEPYKGKGFHYVGEHVRRKEGKKAVASE